VVEGSEIMRPVKLLFSAALVAAVGVGGCLGKPAPSQRLFVLPTSTPPAPRPASSSLGGRTLGLGPVTVASHLDRGSVAVRLDDTRYEYADSMRWASPVEILVRERLVEGLIWFTGAESVEIFPWSGANAPDLHVDVRVVRFEVTSDGSADVAAYWSVRNGKTGERLDAGHFTRREPVEGNGGAAGVEALDRALLGLAERIATELPG
jgi:uncharacterized lipoprotein YmbA